MKDTTGTICQRNSSETAQQNFVKLCSCEGYNMLMCIPTGNFVQFFSQNYALFEFRNLTKMKDLTETVCQRNSSETAQQNFLKFCSKEGHNLRYAYPQEILFNFFFSELRPFFELRKFDQNERYYWNSSLNRISWNFVVKKDLMCRCAYLQEILIQFFWAVVPLFELRNLTKIKDTTQNSSSAQLHRNRSTKFPETL